MKNNIVIILSLLFLGCTQLRDNGKPVGENRFTYEFQAVSVSVDIPNHFYEGSFYAQPFHQYYFDNDNLRIGKLFLSTENPCNYLSIQVMPLPHGCFGHEMDPSICVLDSFANQHFSICKPANRMVPLVEDCFDSDGNPFCIMSKASRFLNYDTIYHRTRWTEDIWEMDSIESYITYYTIRNSYEITVELHRLEHMDSFNYQKNLDVIKSVVVEIAEQ